MVDTNPALNLNWYFIAKNQLEVRRTKPPKQPLRVLSQDEIKSIDDDISLANDELQRIASIASGPTKDYPFGHGQVIKADWFGPTVSLPRKYSLPLDIENSEHFYYTTIKNILVRLKKQHAIFLDDDVLLRALGSQSYLIE